MLQKIAIHSYDVSYEENARQGMDYLRDDLNADESKVSFEQAKRAGSAAFEDDQDRQFTLVYQKENDYVVVRR